MYQARNAYTVGRLYFFKEFMTGTHILSKHCAYLSTFLKIFSMQMQTRVSRMLFTGGCIKQIRESVWAPCYRTIKLNSMITAVKVQCSKRAIFSKMRAIPEYPRGVQKSSSSRYVRGGPELRKAHFIAPSRSGYSIPRHEKSESSICASVGDALLAAVLRCRREKPIIDLVA